MTISAGLLILMLSPGILLCKKGWVRIYPLLLSLLGLVYHYFLSAEGELVVEFLGFSLNLYSYSIASDVLAFAFMIFGGCTYLFLWSKSCDRFYYLFTLWQLGAATAIIYSGDFLSFFIFWELISLSSVMILFREGQFVQAKRYFLYHMLGAILLLVGIAVNYSHTGEMTLDVVAGRLFFLLAVMIKGALMPFHSWLVSVYPNIGLETTVFLSAYTTKVGIVSLLFLLPDLDLQLLGGGLAVVSVVYALKQHKMSRLLSFHLLSQMGYVIAAFGSQTVYGQVGGVYHLVNNIFYKGLLFMVAALLVEVFGTDDLIVIDGRGRKNLWLFVLTIVASGSIAGVPFLNGFVSKMIIKKGLTNIWASNLLTLAGIGTALSFIKVLYYGFLKSTGTEQKELLLKQQPYSSEIFPLIGMGVLAFLCLVLGNSPALILSNYDLSFSLFKMSALWKGIWPIGLALVLFKVMYRQINRSILRITSIFEYADLKDTLFCKIDEGLLKLQRIHSGNVQEYLVWIVFCLLGLWMYVFWVV